MDEMQEEVYNDCSETEAEKFKELPCTLCDEVFHSAKELDKHAEAHKANIKCEVCNKIFRNKDTRRRHRYEKHRDVLLKCDVCDIMYNKTSDMVLHKKFHTKENPYLCLLCLKSFNKLSTLREHHARHEKEIMKKATLQTLFDSDASDLDDDNDTSADLPVGAIKSDSKVSSEGYVCDVCGRTFPLQRYLTQHSHIHAPIGTFQCDLCDKVFNLKCRLIEHLKYHRKRKSRRPYMPKGSNTKDKLVPKIRICDTCGRSFHDDRHFRRHREYHLPKGHFPCPVCNKTFDLNIRLKLHLMWHRREVKGMRPGTFRCDFCGKIFDFEKALYTHRLLHLESHTCSLCGKVFNKKWNLKTHMAIHLGRKPYSCSYCGASYADRSNLKKHLSKHPADLKAEIVFTKTELYNLDEPPVSNNATE